VAGEADQYRCLAQTQPLTVTANRNAIRLKSATTVDPPQVSAANMSWRQSQADIHQIGFILWYGRLEIDSSAVHGLR